MNPPSTAPVAASSETCHIQDPGRIADLAAAVRQGSASATSLVESCLERIRAADVAVEAWRLVDEEGALAQAARLDREAAGEGIRGPLHGIPVGIKDIIDVAGLPTRCNSRSRDKAGPAVADAAVVATLRAAGAVVLGKLHTTEFAFFDPSPARNPHHTDHTPGGSSSGSAAAVAAGMVPMSVGTQTVASVNRPAAYCGIAAFKPSTGLLSSFGITPLSPMYNTPGFFGWSVADAAAGFRAVCPAFATPSFAGPSPLFGDNGRLRVIRVLDPLLEETDDEIVAAVDGVARRLTDEGHHVSEAGSPVDFGSLFENQQTTTHYEMGRALAGLRDRPPGEIGPKLLAAIERGQSTSESDYLAAHRAVNAARLRFFEAFSATHAFLWPATPKTAPEGLAWTGEPRFIAPWTALGGPVVTLPAAFGAKRLPIGVLLCARPGTDSAFADAVSGLKAIERP